MTFDLRAAIKQAVENSTSADPHLIATELGAMIPSRALRSVVEVLLVDAVREQVREDRAAVPFLGGADGNTSARWANVARDSHAGTTRYFVGHESDGNDNGWKFFHDLIADDCESIAGDYTTRAEANKRLASYFITLAASLRRRRVQTVGELPEDERKTA